MTWLEHFDVTGSGSSLVKDEVKMEVLMTSEDDQQVVKNVRSAHYDDGVVEAYQDFWNKRLQMVTHILVFCR